MTGVQTCALPISVRIVDGAAEIEVSGNVTAANVTQLVDLGVNIVSCGALTHSAPILDLSLKHLLIIAAGGGPVAPERFAGQTSGKGRDDTEGVAGPLRERSEGVASSPCSQEREAPSPAPDSPKAVR